MADKRRQRGARRGAGSKRRSQLKLRRLPNSESWELVHPRCARQRAEDVEEVRAMIEADEVEIATEELRYLLDGCADFVEAHCLLGELALTGGDLKLARAHFGYAYNIAASSLPRGGLRGILPYELSPNQHFFQAAKGLSGCLHQLGSGEKALEIVVQMISLDPADPLSFAALGDAIRATKTLPPRKTQSGNRPSA